MSNPTYHWGLLWVSLHSASCCKLAIRDTNPNWCQGHHCTDHLTLEHTLRHTHFTVYRETASMTGLCSVLRPRQHSIGYMRDGFTGQKTQPTVSKY